MKGNKLVIAVILALIVCLVLIPTCAFADGEGEGEVVDQPVVLPAAPAEKPVVIGDDGALNQPTTPPTEGEVNSSDDGKGENPSNPGDNEAGNTTSGGENKDEVKDPEVSNEVVTLPATLEGEGVAGVSSGVASIGDTTYATIGEAISAAGSNETTIVIKSDVTESITIGEGQNIILDLNGKTLTNEDGKHTIWNNGTLTIIDSIGTGVVDNVSNARGALVNVGTANIEGGTLTRSKENGTTSGANGNSWYVIKNFGTMTISGNTKVEQNGQYSSLIQNGWYDGSDPAGKRDLGIAPADNKAKLTINGGTFSGGINTVKNDDYGYLTINDGVFTNVQTVVMNWNVAKINGGTFTTTGNHVMVNGYYNDTSDKGEFTITGGEFNSANGGNGNLFGYNGVAKVGKGTITINGGSFDGVANSDETPYDVIYNNGVFTDSNVKNLVNKDNVAVISANGKTAIADNENAASIKEIIDEAVKSGDALVIENLPENVTVGNVPEGVTIINKSGSTLTVNGVEVKPGESYTVPTTAAPAFAPLSAKYFVLEGKAQQWTDGDLEFVLNSNAVVKVLIDGVEVEFTVAEDGTVTIASAVIEALDAGTHEIEFVFADGSCTTTFTK